MNRSWQVSVGHLMCGSSVAGQGRRRPPRSVRSGHLTAGSTARTGFVAALAFALAACGGGAGMGAQPPVISAFTASPTDAVTGHRITLSWTVAGATDISISGIGAVAGNTSDVYPTTDTEYVLTAKNVAGTSTQHVQVTLYPPPVNWFAPFPHNNPD